MPSLEFRRVRSEEHTSELQSHSHLVCRLLLEKKKQEQKTTSTTHVSTIVSLTMLVAHLYTRHHRLSACIYTRHTLMDTTPLLMFFFLNDRATTEINTLPLHDPLPI